MIIDPFDRSRVWVLSRVRGTHKGPFAWAGINAAPTNKVIDGGPEVLSYSFNDVGQCYKITEGYTVDPLLGNTNGLAGVQTDATHFARIYMHVNMHGGRKHVHVQT
jgi:hypothetical protein